MSDETDEERIERYAAQRAVNDKLEKLAAKLVKQGWTATYVGGSVIGVGVDMLIRAGVPRDAVIESINKVIDEYERGDTRSAFPDIDREVPQSS